MARTSPSESLRVLCLDGGGIKGYTSLLILKRIFRTMMAEGQLTDIPRPCNVFDLIIGTSTGGLIAVMLGRLHMSIDECIAKYEQVGAEVFGKKPHGGKFGKMLKGLGGSAFYDIGILQEQVKKILDSKDIPRDTEFLEPSVPLCKVMLCVTRTKISKPDVLRNYESLHPTAENYSCRIWEAASATAAAPMFFKGVQFNGTGERLCDGGLRRNNPINEALSEITREREWKNKKLGCVLSLGTGVAKSDSVSSHLAGVLKGALAIMTDSDDIARVFASSELGIDLTRSHRYFRFSVPQGMQDLQLDEWKETEKMRALTTDYLNHVGSGDLVMQCAKSLLYPDENLQTEIKPKLSMMPSHPCTHFVERHIFTDALLKFFKPNTNSTQIFVLWGLGGIGKTQIALKFAQIINHRLSVFWIRADRFTNFSADYAQILSQLDPTISNSNYGSKDFSIMLEKTRQMLENISGEWLLILDNADDLDIFLGRGPKYDDDEFAISRFIPRQGRILITTRDPRFQGTVAAANDGLKISSMSEEEAIDLLIGSIPGHLIRDVSESMNHAKLLVEELGYLPLAIAQAAANILEQHLTLAEYVTFYNDKKQRMELMEAPAHDFQNTDPRNSSQSVHITWQISFDILKEKSPLSATFLSYIGCFHWQHIPRVLLQRLPEFHELAESVYIQLTKKPLNLSLLEEEENESGFIEYSVHPLVHENIASRLSPTEFRAYLEPAIELLSTAYPVVHERTSKYWTLAVYLAPHATHQIELCDEIEISTKPLTILLLKLSHFFAQSNRFNTAADLAERAVALASLLWASEPHQLLEFRSNLITRYTDASRGAKAEAEARSALNSLDSETLKSSMSPDLLEVQRVHFKSLLSTALLTASNTAGAREREALHREQLESGLVNERTSHGVIIKHNLAHALFKQNKHDAAAVMNNELLEFAESEEGRSVVEPRLYLIMLNLKAAILRPYGSGSLQKFESIRIAPTWEIANREERLRIHELVLSVSLEKLGVEDIDTWKAANNLLGCLSEQFQQDRMGQVLWQVLPPGIAAKITTEGKFGITIRELTTTAEDYLDFLSSTEGEDDKATKDFRKLLTEWISSSDPSGSTPTPVYDVRLNNRGAKLQYKGLFEDAERLHHQSIDICLEVGADVPHVYYYNLMLAIARQGRIEEAFAVREQHRAAVTYEEASHGTLESRLERDRKDEEVYREAQALNDAGHLVRGGQWWRANERVLTKYEYRYGRLKLRVKTDEAPADLKTEKMLRKKPTFRFPFRSKLE